jgi:hypothetical protein
LTAIDFTDLDTENLEPDRLPIGSELQDCSLIASAFERAAHSIPTEAAAFATVSRSVQNSKTFGRAAETSLQSYLKPPETPDSTREDGAVGRTDQHLESFNFGASGSISQEDFSKKMIDLLKNCIPCSLRINAYLELHPKLDLLAALEIDLLGRLKLLGNVGKMLKNFDIYGDLCELLNLLSFMCIPDLQRIIATLMALLILDVPSLDGLVGLLQGLIAPLFAPVLQGLTGLLDQFNLLVVSPLDCVIDAIKEQMQKLGLELDPSSPLVELNSGLGELNNQIVEAKQIIQARLDFYINQMKKLLGELSFGDAAYLQFSLKKLKIIRMVGFVVGIISAITKGHDACSSQGKPPQKSELDNFFDTFLNPNQPFNLYMDEEGVLQIEEDIPGFLDAVNPPTEAEPLPNFGDVFKFEGEDLVNPQVAQQQAETADSLLQPASASIRCNLNPPTVDQAEQINQWIRELNQVT